MVPGLPPVIVSRGQWGADESMRSAAPLYDNGIRAGIVHHTVTANDYATADSAGIVRGIYGYHTRVLGWCDIAYNALVDKFGHVFDGRFGGITKAVEGSHTGGFNRNTWAVTMIGNFDLAEPIPEQVHSVGQLFGVAAGDGPRGSQGNRRLDLRRRSVYALPPGGATPVLPTRLRPPRRRDTACPGRMGYAASDRIRDVAARFDKPASSADLADSMRGGAIFTRWQAMGGMTGPLGAPTSPETPGYGPARYVTFDRGAIYWSPASGAAPVMGVLYDSWPHWVSSAARWDCRPAPPSRNPNGSCRTSNTKP
jgi:uncharacterized protein with LGFP repeats